MTITINKPRASISLIDESLFSEGGHQADLFLEVGLDAVTFCLVDVNTQFTGALIQYQFQKVLNYATLLEKLEDVFADADLLKRKFRKVHCSVVNQKSTLVPVPVFERGKEYLLLGLNCSLNGDDLVYSDKLKQVDALNIFAVPSDLKRFIVAQFPLAEFHHYSTSLLEGIMLDTKKTGDKRVVLNVHASYFEIVIAEQKSLLFYNTFRYQSAEDVVYYLLFVFEQFNINSENIRLTITGELDKQSAIYALLYKYVRNISFGERPATLKYAAKLDTIPKHFFFSIYSLQLCV